MFKKQIIECSCSAKKKLYKNNEQYKNTFKEVYSNTTSKEVDILILLELKETHPRIDPFLKFIEEILAEKYKYVIIHSLGCTPEDFMTSDIVSNYITCKNINIKKIISQYTFKSIITIGRALYTITENKFLRPEHFFIPINNEYTFQLDDTFMYSQEFNCNVYPLPPLYQWIENFNIKDCYEYKFSLQQIKRAIKNISIRKNRNINIDFEYIENPNDFLLHCINDSNIQEIAIDTETTGLNFIKDKIFSISLSFEKYKGYFLKFDDIDINNLISLFNTSKKIIMHHAQFDLKMLIMSGVKNARCDFDTMLASHLLNENSPNGLKPLSWIYTMYGGYDIKLQKYMKNDTISNFSNLPKSILLEYACYDSCITFQLYKYFEQRFKEEEYYLLENFNNFIMPSVKMITDIELNGVEIDFKYYTEYNNILIEKSKKLEEEIYRIIGKKININSNKELSKILLDIPGFEIILDDNGEEILTKNNTLKLDKDSLQRYSDEKNIKIAELIIEYKHLIKEISQLGLKDKTKKKGFFASIHNNKLYGGYKLHGTDTGRASGGGGLDSTINFQNMPKTKEFRKLFLCPKDYVIGYADYEGMEVSIASQIAGKGALEQFILEGKDPHSNMGAKIYKYFYNEEIDYNSFYKKAKIEKDEKYIQIRDKGKGTYFQCIYGATNFGISKELNVTIDEADILINVFKETYPEIDRYIQSNREFAKKYGYVKTLLGRKRRLPELTYIGKDSFRNRSSFSVNNLLNAAINAPIQGTSGQTTIIAMYYIWKEFKEKNLKSKIVINVHDEIVFYLHKDELELANKIIKYWMEFPYYKNNENNKVKLKAELELGEIWKFGEKYEYYINNKNELNKLIKINNKRNLENIK